MPRAAAGLPAAPGDRGGRGIGAEISGVRVISSDATDFPPHTIFFNRGVPGRRGRGVPGRRRGEIVQGATTPSRGLRVDGARGMWWWWWSVVARRRRMRGFW